MIELVDIAHAQELDEYVMQNETCHFMQTSLWGKVKRSWGWYGLICRDDSGKVVGTMALLRHDLRFGNRCLLYAPCGPIFDDERAFCELTEEAKRLAGSIHAYILRMDPCIPEEDKEFPKLAAELGFSLDRASDFSLFQPRCVYLLDLNGLTPETLMAGYHTSTRRNVRIAQRKGVEVCHGTLDDLPDFCRMMGQVAKKNGFTPRSETYFREFLTGMGQYATLYLAKLDGKTIGATISTIMGNRSCFMYSCSDQSCLAFRPNEILQYQMQCDALKAGCRWFDFRGVEGYPTEDNPHYGLHTYKAGFGAYFCAYEGQFDYVLRPGTVKLLAVLSRFIH